MLAGRALEMMVGVAKISDLTVLWALVGLFAALAVAMKGQDPEHDQIRDSLSRPTANATGASLLGAKANRGLWIWKLTAVVCLIGAMGNLTWTGGISYPRTAVLGGHALE